MTSPSLSRVRQAQSRRVHLVMRDGTMIEGYILIGEDQLLLPYLNGRRGGWLNLNRAHRPKLAEKPGHVIVQTDNIVLATAPDSDLPIANAPSSGVEDRSLEVVLLGGKVVRGFISAATNQRLSDYIAAQTGRFMSLQRSTLASDGRVLGDLALHMGTIEMLRDLRESAIDEGPTAPEATA